MICFYALAHFSQDQFRRATACAAVADAVGQKLRQTAAGRQVLCVTHLAPIAAFAEHHLVVDKRVVKGTTRTSVTALDLPARVDEMARMLGGEQVTDTSRRHARELLKGARAAD
jgi:DNA repair protein RecN (Recombination protein N)